MKYDKLGRSDISISRLCMGTMTFGSYNTKEEGFAIMDYAFEHGINFFDSAEMYPTPPNKNTAHLTNKIIGEWMKQRKNRNKIVIADKIAGRSIPRNSVGWLRPTGEDTRLNKEQINFAIDNSLQNLGTDYIDLYQLHWPDRLGNFFYGLEYKHKEDESISIEETLGALEENIKKGKIRHIGISNETAWGASQFIKISEKNNWTKILTIQNPYSLVNRSFEVGLAEICIREKVGLLAYSPLAGGVLSGKYLDGKMPAKSRMSISKERYPRYWTLNTEPAVKSYIAIAKKYGLDCCQMALKFCEIQQFMSAVIIGATNLEQLKNNIQSINLELTNEIIEDINKVQLIYSNPCV